MKKIAILGCENSHANTFIGLIRGQKKYSDVEVVGVYSDEREAVEKLAREYGVCVMDDFDEAVGKVDGLVITARNGDNHYRFAKPYIKSGIPMFIDKPVTISEKDALEFFTELKKNNIRVSGGSSLRHAEAVKKFKEENSVNKYGKTIGGVVRAPMDFESKYGGFSFYAHHLVESVCEIFGRYPHSVYAEKSGDEINALFKYDDYSVTGVFVQLDYYYSVTRLLSCAEDDAVGTKTEEIVVDESVFEKEFSEFYELLQGNEQAMSYRDFIAPVYITNAILRSLQSGKAEKVNEINI